MNRGIHLSILEPTQNDLKEMAKSIVQSFNENFSDFFGKLDISFYKYKEFLKKNILNILISMEIVIFIT